MESTEALYESLIEQELLTDFAGLSDLPNLKLFVKKYALSLEGNDRKAVSLFGYYETLDRVRSLQLELLNIKKGAVSRMYLKKLLGAKRSNHLGSFEDWANKMLQFLSSKSKDV